MARSRSAFTLVELLVVITVIVILMMLLFPAVQAVRQASRKTQCKNNMRQIALACHSHLEAQGSFPNLRFRRFGSETDQGWMTSTLPYLEQTTVDQLYDWTLDWYAPENKEAVTVPISAFRCPSVGGSGDDLQDQMVEGQFAGVWGDAEYVGALTEYAGVAGIMGGLRSAGYVPETMDTLNAGVIGTNRPRRAGEIPDGMSRTLLLVEAAGRPTVYRGGKPSMIENDQSLVLEAETLHTSGNIPGAWAAPNGLWFRGFTFDGLEQPGPCAVNCSNFTGGIYSFHPGGANVAMADGGVRFLTRKTDIYVAIALVTRQGGENDDQIPSR